MAVMSAELAANSYTGPLTDSLEASLEWRLQQARSRLLRITRSFRISADAADDIVQETCIRAWRRLEQLQSAERFDAWLDAICRNECRTYLRARRAMEQRAYWCAPVGRVSVHDTDVSRAIGLASKHELAGIADPLALDPFDALDREELGLLLDRALGYLASHAREALEMHYLRGLSTVEAASALGIGVPAFEVRLHRARAHVRDVLRGPLRSEAEAFDLAVSPATPSGGWQVTRITCYLCGRRRLLGTFEEHTNGRRELRLRCPVCSPRHGVDVFRSKGIAPLGNMRAFRPALTRAMRGLEERTRNSLAAGWDTCLHCGSRVRRCVVEPSAFLTELPQSLQRYWVVAACQRPGCPGLGAWPATEPTLWLDPTARWFMEEHPRWMMTPEEGVDWQGCPAIRVGVVDLASASKLTLLVDRLTLQVLASFQD